jgi:hypothetical protein
LRDLLSVLSVMSGERAYKRVFVGS